MPISDKQLPANRANAAKSTGPKSPAIRRNAATFENLGSAILIEGESRPRFIALLHSVYGEFLPETPSERALVEKLAVYHWLHLRALTLESAAMAHEMRRRSESEPDEPPLTRATQSARSIDERSRRSEFGRAAGRFDRQYHRALEALQRIKDRTTAKKISSPNRLKSLKIKNRPLKSKAIRPIKTHPGPMRNPPITRRNGFSAGAIRPKGSRRPNAGPAKNALHTKADARLLSAPVIHPHKICTAAPLFHPRYCGFCRNPEGHSQQS